MSGYLDPDVGERFDIRIRKTVIDQPTVHWFNTYEVCFFDVGTTSDLDSIGSGLVAFEAELLLAPYMIDQVTISTHAEDAHPYNPMSFSTQPYTQGGQRATGGNDLLDLRVALFLKRLPFSGRIGRLFLRGSLHEGDIEAPAGVARLVDTAAMVTAVENAKDAGGLASNLNEGPGQPHIVMIGASNVTRTVSDIVVGGVSFIKLNHKYFDRA